MKVLFQNRVDLYTKPGGDTVQMEKTKEALEKLGVQVDIDITLEPDLTNYDLVHLYNTTRVHETFVQYRNAKKQKKKVVISPIYHSISEIERFMLYGQSGPLKILNKLAPSFYLQEEMKNIIRLRDPRQRKAILLQFAKGFRSEQVEVLQGVDRWIVLAEQEATTITKEIGVSNEYSIVPNGVEFAKKTTSSPKVNLPIKNYVLSVGRIEPRKNQINLIQALKDTGLNLVFIGQVNPNYNRGGNAQYFKQFTTLVDSLPQVFWLKNLPHQELPAYYALAQVHANISWFEVVSLVNMEAASLGCNLVISEVGYQKEYFGQEAFYCDPNDVSQIRAQVLSAYQKPKNNHLREKMRKKYTWENTGEKTLEVYQSVLQKS